MIIVFLLGVMIFLNGCTTTDDGGKIASAKGAILSFIPGSPPSELDEGDSVDVGVKVENEADVPINGRLCVWGLSTAYGGFVEEQCDDFVLAGMLLDGTKVSKASKEFHFQSLEGYNVRDREYIKPTIIARATYSCELTAGPQICVKKMLGEKDEECSRTEVFTGKNLYSKNAPITLTRTEKQISTRTDGVMLNVMLTLKKNADGYVVNSLDDAEESLKYFADIGVSYSGYGEMECTSDGIKIENGKLEWKKDQNEKIIKCKKLLTNVGSLEKEYINLRLRYFYRVDKTTSITVNNVKEGGEWSE
jgi:hypothetical protein